VHIGVEIVDLGHVAAGPLEEHDTASWPIARDRSFHMIDPVGRDAVGTGRAVAAVVHHATAALSLLVPHADYPDVGIDGPDRLEDVGVSLSGVRVAQPVLHAEAAIVRRLVFDPVAGPAERLGSAVVGRAHRVGDLPLDVLRYLGSAHVVFS